jgi:hypothetical protein
MAECSERRFPRTVAQLWLISYRAWSDALSASAGQSALFSMVKYFQDVYERRSSTMAHSGPPAERGGEVALKKPSHHTLARVWLATVLSRICPPLFMGRSRLIASHRSCDATLQEMKSELSSAWVMLRYATSNAMRIPSPLRALSLSSIANKSQASNVRSSSRRSIMPSRPSGMHALCAAQFSYWLRDIGLDADRAIRNRVA